MRSGSTRACCPASPGTAVPGAFNGKLPRFAIAKTHQRESRRQVLVPFAKRRIAGILPRAIGELPCAQCGEKLVAPVVGLAFVIFELVLAPGGHRFAEGLVVIKKARF